MITDVRVRSDEELEQRRRDLLAKPRHSIEVSQELQEIKNEQETRRAERRRRERMRQETLRSHPDLVRVSDIEERINEPTGEEELERERARLSLEVERTGDPGAAQRLDAVEARLAEATVMAERRTIAVAEEQRVAAGEAEQQEVEDRAKAEARVGRLVRKRQRNAAKIERHTAELLELLTNDETLRQRIEAGRFELGAPGHSPGWRDPVGPWVAGKLHEVYPGDFDRPHPQHRDGLADLIP